METKPMTGRRRLRVLLSLTGGLTCAALMAAVLLIYGPPFETDWWWAMAGILAAAFLVPLLYARAVDWVIDGYGAAKDS